MATRLGDLLDDARRRTFVGRRRELASFDDVLLGRVVTNNAASTQSSGELLELYRSLAAGYRTSTGDNSRRSQPSSTHLWVIRADKDDHVGTMSRI